MAARIEVESTESAPESHLIKPANKPAVRPKTVKLGRMNLGLPRLPRRSPKFGIGKEIGGAVYVHRLYEDRLGDVVLQAKASLPAGFDYHVVKYNFRTRAVSFVQCHDFDSAPEPTVGDIVTVDGEGNVRRRPQPRDPEVYHHKWLFVADDYQGFEVQQSMQRSSAWMQLGGVDRRRIGRKSYWETHVAPRIDEGQLADREEG